MKRLRGRPKKTIICNIIECQRMGVARGLCSAHYQRFYKTGNAGGNEIKTYRSLKDLTREELKEYKRNWLRTWRRTHQEQYLAYAKRYYQLHKEQIKVYSNKYRERHRLYFKEYRRKNGIKSIRPMHKMRFGGIRDFIFQRDGFKCVMCEMTDKQHMDAWDRHLTINHIDHAGRYSEYQNNDPDNLETLCLRCHGHKDAIRHGKYSKYRVNPIGNGA